MKFRPPGPSLWKSLSLWRETRSTRKPGKQEEKGQNERTFIHKFVEVRIYLISGLNVTWTGGVERFLYLLFKWDKEKSVTVTLHLPETTNSNKLQTVLVHILHRLFDYIILGLVPVQFRSILSSSRNRKERDGMKRTFIHTYVGIQIYPISGLNVKWIGGVERFLYLLNK